MPTPQLPALDPTIAVAVGAALVVLGLAFAFWGRGIWKRIMALIGMILGGVLGFIAGFTVMQAMSSQKGSSVADRIAVDQLKSHVALGR